MTIKEKVKTLSPLLEGKSVGTPVFVRVPVDDLTATKKVLEMGPDGNLYNIMRYSINPKAIPNTGLALAYKINDKDPDAPLKFPHSIKFNVITWNLLFSRMNWPEIIIR